MHSQVTDAKAARPPMLHDKINTLFEINTATRDILEEAHEKMRLISGNPAEDVRGNGVDPRSPHVDTVEYRLECLVEDARNAKNLARELLDHLNSVV